MPPHLQIQTLKNNLRSAERVIIKLKRMLKLCRNPSTHLMPFEKPVTEFTLLGQPVPQGHVMYNLNMRRYWYKYANDFTNYWYAQYVDPMYQRQMIYTNEQPAGWVDPDLRLAGTPDPRQEPIPDRTSTSSANSAPRPSGRGSRRLRRR